MAVVEETPPDFSEFGIDDRILNAVARLGWEAPTLIQASAIPHILEGKDVLARARTGSGKTGAFAIPVIQKVIQAKKISKKQATRAVILGPSKELCSQLYADFKALARDCSRDVSIVDLSHTAEEKGRAPLLMERPDIVIGTPSRIVKHAAAEDLDLRHLAILVVDEADLIFSFGFDEDVKEFRRLAPPTGFQVILMSATLTPEVLELKKLTLHNPVVLRLQEPQLPPILQLTQYHILVEEEEKFLLIYALLKLHLLKGKTIIFVRNVDRCYKVKLFLEQFGISSCIVNAELPAKSRCHIVAQFNAGMYDIVIASDEANLEEGPGEGQGKTKQKSKRVADKESGISRGLDFQFVSNVINLDFPMDVDSYIHRVGRTARGKNTGTAVSFVDHNELERFNEVQEYLKSMYGETDDVTRPFKFKMDEVDPMRYRSRDAYKSVTKIAIREARLKEIRQEILSSDKLKPHFEANPADLAVLRHDKALHTIKIQPHLKDMPEYIVPASLLTDRGLLILGPRKKKVKKKGVRPPESNFDFTKLKRQKKDSAGKLKRLRNAKDPLKSLKFDGFAAAKS